MRVRSLQRGLLITSGVVCVGVGVAGWRLWRSMRETVRVMAERTTAVAGTAQHESDVVVTRVRVRRRVGDPNDPGEVLETQYLGRVQRAVLVDGKEEQQQKQPGGIVSKLKVGCGVYLFTCDTQKVLRDVDAPSNPTAIAYSGEGTDICFACGWICALQCVGSAADGS